MSIRNKTYTEHNTKYMNMYTHKNTISRLDTEQNDLLISLTNEILTNEFTDWNITHIKAIKQYSGSSGDLNQILLYNKKYKHETWAKKLIKDLDNTFSVHKLSRNIQVFSGLGFTPESYAFHPNEEYIKVFIPCYMSTSLSENTASGFGEKEDLLNKSRHVYVYADYRNCYSTQKIKYKKLSYNEWINLNKDVKKFGTSSVRNKIITHYTSKWKINNKNVHYADQTIVDIKCFKHLLRIEVPKNSYGGYINHHSSHFENEYIIPRNSIIHVEPVPTVNGIEQRVTWYGKLVYDGKAPTNICPWDKIKPYSERNLKR